MILFLLGLRETSMTNKPLKDVVHSDIKYFQKKLNKYINQGITIKKELKELRKNATQNVRTNVNIHGNGYFRMQFILD